MTDAAATVVFDLHDDISISVTVGDMDRHIWAMGYSQQAMQTGAAQVAAMEVQRQEKGTELSTRETAIFQLCAGRGEEICSPTGNRRKPRKVLDFLL